MTSKDSEYQYHYRWTFRHHDCVYIFQLRIIMKLSTVRGITFALFLFVCFVFLATTVLETLNTTTYAITPHIKYKTNTLNLFFAIHWHQATPLLRLISDNFSYLTPFISIIYIYVTQLNILTNRMIAFSEFSILKSRLIADLLVENMDTKTLNVVCIHHFIV